MLSFKEYLNEMFGTPYPHREAPEMNDDDNHHHYMFQDHKKRPYVVQIKKHKTQKGISHVNFYAGSKQDSEGNWIESTFKPTKMSGRSASRVIGTVGHIMRQHAPKHDVSHFQFAADPEEGSRKALYKRIARRYGGQHHEDEQGVGHYIIPAKQG